MTAPQAGWYPDPAGNQSKLRYWDGARWTNDYYDVPQTKAAYQSEENNSYAADANAQRQNVPWPATSPEGEEYRRFDNAQIYPMTSSDRTTRLVAFIFALIATCGGAIFILPLAWGIPMTVRTWNIYKGRKPNTLCFDVCSLIFMSLITGVLLLMTTRDEK